LLPDRPRVTYKHTLRQVDHRSVQLGGDRIERHYRWVVYAALGSADDVAMNSRLRRERNLRDAQLQASTPYLRADAYQNGVGVDAR
jgi:hypothetical protein